MQSAIDGQDRLMVTGLCARHAFPLTKILGVHAVRDRVVEGSCHTWFARVDHGPSKGTGVQAHNGCPFAMADDCSRSL